MLIINKKLTIDIKEVKFRMIKSSGPGGQNINKNATAITLEFDAQNSKSLSKKIKYIILNTPNKYLTKTGKIIISSNKHKSQKRNKSETIERLIRYFSNILKPKKQRIPTKPTKSSVERRLKEKKRNSYKKSLRNSHNPIKH
jgi:ribosome-associated protein